MVKEGVTVLFFRVQGDFSGHGTTRLRQRLQRRKEALLEGSVEPVSRFLYARATY